MAELKYPSTHEGEVIDRAVTIALREASAAQSGHMTAQQAILLSDLDSRVTSVSGSVGGLNTQFAALQKQYTTLSADVAKKVDKTVADSTYVEKESCKSLMSDEERMKLFSIAPNANNYKHPISHAATMITPDATHRFVTDSQIAEWNKVGKKVDAVEGKGLSSNDYTNADKDKVTLDHEKIGELINSDELIRKDIAEVKTEMSVTISEFVAGVTVGSGSTPEDGTLVYDTTANKFLWKVMYNQNPTPTYFAKADKEILAGTTPKMGVRYKCGKEVYLGVDGGLSLQLRTVIEEI